VVVVTVVVMVTVFLASLELVYVLSARRRGSVSGCVLWGRLGATVVVVAVVVVVTMFFASGERFATFTNRLSNDRCDGSSSKNECNGKFDLNHFEY
jgi:hypothetical protein